jgi:phosphinothricin acetyltransferase
MTVRPAAQGDAGAVAAIWNHYIRETVVTFNPVEKTEMEVAALIAGLDPMVVVEEAGAVAGFARHFQFRSGEGYRFTREHTILLAPGIAGRGLGRALMVALVADAKARGMHSLFAGICEGNSDGIAFHARMGFAEVGRLPEVGYKFGRWFDLILMQKRL